MELSRAGFNALGVDHSKNKDTPQCKAINIDLTTESGQRILMSLLEERRVVFVHFAPPCGTATRAREIRRKGVDPKPLRTEEFPD
eukprot:6223854-Karenia_brevis.AAC.1